MSGKKRRWFAAEYNKEAVELTVGQSYMVAKATSIAATHFSGY